MRIQLRNEQLRHKNSDGTAFVSFDLAMTSNTGKHLLTIHNCLYSGGKIFPPRTQFKPGRYSKIVSMDMDLFRAAYEQILQARWWEEWEGLGEPIEPSKYLTPSNGAGEELQAA